MVSEVCSSWVFMSSAAYRRCQFYTWGDSSQQGVRDGTVMCSRTMLMVAVAASRGMAWFLEPPLSSVFAEMPCFQLVMRTSLMYRQHVPLGAYGAKSRKDVQIFSNRSWIGGLHKAAPKGKVYEDSGKVVKKTISKKFGKKAVSGGPALKRSQAYPAESGHEFASLFQACREAQTQWSLEACSEEEADSVWGDAGLDSVLTYLEGLLGRR